GEGAQPGGVPTGCRHLKAPRWPLAVTLEGWNVTESQIVRDWTAQARAEGVREGEAKGKAEGNADMLLEGLKGKFGALPADLEAVIRQTTDLPQLQRWGALAGKARTLPTFRRDAAV